jgi:transcriptional regulator
MYSPDHFKIEDAETLYAFMRQHSFATLITHDGATSHAAHMPVLFGEKEGTQGVLVTHLARANPQWHHLESGAEALVIFTGPHAYISPAWYATMVAKIK